MTKKIFLDPLPAPELTRAAACTHTDWAALGRRCARLLDALEQVNPKVAKGSFVKQCAEMQAKIIADLKLDGWEVKFDARNYWRVIPPKDRGSMKIGPQSDRERMKMYKEAKSD